jgi:hypothetical protein
MTDLGPAAQAVLKAAHDSYWILDAEAPADPNVIAAAALRAAADQVVPEPSAHLPEQNCRWYRLGVSAYRHNLLAIAAELENAND